MPPPPPPAPPARIRPALTAPAFEFETDEVPKAVPPPTAAAPNRGAWNGGHAWVQVRLRMEHRGQVQDLLRRATLVWDGAEFAVKPQGTSRKELWMDRLQLLINLPFATEALNREITSTTKATLTGEVGIFECERVEGEDRFPQQRRAFTYWVAPEFPAGALQAKVSFPDLAIELRVLGYGPEPGGE